MKTLLTCLFVLTSLGAWAQTQDEKTDSLQEARTDSIELEAELRGVAITAQRSLVKQDIDRIGYDVAADEDSRTMTVLDMLRKVPFVTVDGDDNILVKGSPAFKVYKNGRLDPTLTKNAKEILRAMPASMVRRIEVITDPGAREDAEGTAAILNIVLMDNRRMEGVTGSVTGSLNTLLHPNLGTYLMTQVGKLTASADYGYGGMSKRETQACEDGWTQYATTGNRAEYTDAHKHPGSAHYADIDASLEIDSLNLVSASLGGYFYNLNMQGDQSMSMLDPAGAVLYSYNRHYWMPDYLHHSWQGRMDYEHRTRRPDERWTASYMLALTRQHSDNEETYSDLSGVPFPYTGFLVQARERFTEHTLQLDWLRPLGKGHQLETGTKYICRLNHSNNRQEFYGTQDSTVTTFAHRTHVAALYGDYIYRRESLSLRAGLRYEYSRMSGDTFHRNLHDVVPQASMKWQIDARQSLKLAYITSIQRPGIEYLNPAVEASPLSLQQGNPTLRSNRLQQAHLIYMYMGRRLTLNLAPVAKWSRGGIGTMQTAQGDVKYRTYGNILDYRRLQLEGYMQWKPWSKTTVVLNANLGFDRHKNPSLGLSLSRFCGFLYGYVQQKMWWRLQLTMAAYGQVGQEVSNVYGYSEPWWAGTLSLQRTFLKDDRLSVRLSASLPFTAYKGYTSRIVQGDYTLCSHQQQRSRSFLLSVSYRFGRLQSDVRKTETSILNDDLVGGIAKSR